MRESIVPIQKRSRPYPSRPRTLIVAMSSRPAIPRRVALQQSPPPFHQPCSACFKTEALATIRQRMVTCPFRYCLNLGVQSIRLSLSTLSTRPFRPRDNLDPVIGYGAVPPLYRLRVAMIIAGVLGLLVGPWIAYEDYASRVWASAIGKVIDSRVEQTPRNYRIVVSYTFGTGGKVYSGHRYRPGSNLISTASSAEGIVAQYPRGSSATVYYDPANPKRSALKVGLDEGDFYLPGFGVAALAFGLLWGRVAKG